MDGATEPSIVLVEWTEDELDPGEITDDLGGDDLSMHTTVGATTYQVSAGSFFQIHRRAPEVLIDAVLAGLDLAPGDHVLDLYAGVGLFTVPIAQAVGTDGVVIAVESSPEAVADAEANLASFTQAQVVEASVTARRSRSCSAAPLQPSSIHPARASIEVPSRRSSMSRRSRGWSWCRAARPPSLGTSRCSKTPASSSARCEPSISSR